MYVNFGYFRAHMYTCVPAQIREDMTRIRGMGADAVTISVLEQDLHAAVDNMRIIEEAARNHGMQLYADIARWGGLVSGTPKVPSLWASTRPDVWKRHPDGRPVESFGPVASVFHPDTFVFFTERLREMFELVPFDGVFWNEPKSLHATDHSEAAKAWFAEHGGDIGDLMAHARAHARFFGRLNRVIRKLSPTCDICCFVMANKTPMPVAEAFAGMDELDTFGCDGRPWRLEDDTAYPADSGKTLQDHAPAYMQLARKHNRKTFAFLENIALPDAFLPVLDKGLPETLAMGFDHVLCYYYGRSVESPDHCMEIVKKHIRAATERDAR